MVGKCSGGPSQGDLARQSLLPRGAHSDATMVVWGAVGDKLWVGQPGADFTLLDEGPWGLGMGLGASRYLDLCQCKDHNMVT